MIVMPTNIAILSPDDPSNLISSRVDHRLNYGTRNREINSHADGHPDEKQVRPLPQPLRSYNRELGIVVLYGLTDGSTYKGPTLLLATP